MCGEKNLCVHSSKHLTDMFISRKPSLFITLAQKQTSEGQEGKKHASAKTISSVFDLLVVSIWL